MRPLLSILGLIGAMSLLTPPVYAELYPAVPDYAKMAKQIGGGGLSSHKTAAGFLFCATALCNTLSPPAPVGPKGEGMEVSLHSVRLAKGGPIYEVECSEGPSGDPACAFHEAPTPLKHRTERVKREPVPLLGEAFIIPGDGCLYVVQYWNATHTSRQKYCPDKSHNLALEGPSLSYAGIQGSAKADIALYEAPDKGAKAFHTIKAEGFVEVVLATRDKSDPSNVSSEWYLLKDKFGLVGWASQEQLQVTQGGSLVKGLGFQGD